MRLAMRSEIIVLLAVGAAYLLVWPVGEYLVGDEWIFARSLALLHETGSIRILDYNPMSLVGHILWGGAFTSLFGFGFGVAKLSTVALLVIECFAVRSLLLRAGARDGTATCAVLVLLFNPLHFFQGFLYATDVPTLAWSSLALCFYTRGFSMVGTGSLRNLTLGSLFAAIAWGVRQGAIVVVVAALLYLLLFERARLREPATWLACFALPAVAVVGFQAWYQLVHGPTTSYLSSGRTILAALRALDLRGGAFAAYALGCYVAFFLLPLLFAFPFSGRRALGTKRSAATLVVWSGIGAAFVWRSVYLGQLFPYLRNKITRFGFLTPNEVIVGAREVWWGDTLGWIASVLLALGAAIFVARWLRGREPRDADLAYPPDPEPVRAVVVRFAGLLLALQLAYGFATFGILFDRHLIALLPAALVVLVGSQAPGVHVRLVPYALCLVPYALYAVAGTHDVHAFSRAAAAAGDRLIARGVDPQRIDAGLAFNGWHMYERSWEMGPDGPPRHYAREGRAGAQDAYYLSGLTPAILTQYVVSLSPTMQPEHWQHALPYWARMLKQPTLDNYHVIDELPYRRYWPWGEGHVYTLLDPTVESAPVQR